MGFNHEGHDVHGEARTDQRGGPEGSGRFTIQEVTILFAFLSASIRRFLVRESRKLRFALKVDVSGYKKDGRSRADAHDLYV